MSKIIHLDKSLSRRQHQSESLPEYNVWGSGVEICKDVIASYDEGPEGVKNYYNQYIVGAITGMMVALEETSQIDNGDDLIAQTIFYCREYPSEPLYWAITQTTNLLRGLPLGPSTHEL